MTTKTKPAKGMIEIDDEEYETEEVEYRGVTYTIRELGQHEGDEFDDRYADQKASVANKMWTREAVARSIVSPVTTMEQVSKWPNRKYVTILRVWNRLNVLPEENPTAPAGSAGPTSPDGGEPSPTP